MKTDDTEDEAIVQVQVPIIHEKPKTEEKRDGQWRGAAREEGLERV